MTIESLVPMAFVQSVPRSIGFYGKLGFQEGSTHTPEGGKEPVWGWLTSNRAQLMVAKASHPVVPDQQAILFYLYSSDLVAYRDRLIESGVPVGEIEKPFYAPHGEFRVVDPDGYCLMVTNT